MKLTLFYIVLIVFINIPTHTYSQSYYSIENRKLFGDHLYNNGDFLRAIDEYNFILSKKNNDTLKLKTAESYYRLERYDDAINSFNNNSKISSLRNENQYGEMKSLFMKNDFTKFNNSFLEFENSNKFYNDVKRLSLITSLYLDQQQISNDQFIERFNKNEADELLQFYNEKNEMNYRSPFMAGFLSTVIPGLGKVYTGNYTDGLTSLMGVSLLSYLSYTNFDHNHDFRAWLFAGLATIFYAGNIYGSAASAYIYNEQLNYNYQKKLNDYLKQKNYFIQQFKVLEK